MMNEVLEYAIEKLQQEVEQLGIALTMNEYSIAQQQNLEKKLVRLNDKLDRFKSIEL